MSHGSLLKRVSETAFYANWLVTKSPLLLYFAGLVLRHGMCVGGGRGSQYMTELPVLKKTMFIFL